MRKLLALALGAILAFPIVADAAPIEGKVVTACGAQTYTVGSSGQVVVLATGEVCVDNGTTSGGAAPVIGSVTAADGAALTSVLKTYSQGGVYNGTTIDLSREAVNSLNSAGIGLPAAQQVGQCDDTSPTTITENSFGNGRIDCTTHAFPVEIMPTPAASAGIAAVVSSALETGHVLLAGAGNLYGAEVATTSAAGYLLVFNSTTVPAAGAVTPVAVCYAGAFGTCALQFDPPLVMSTGISVAFSVAVTPFTKTDSATAFLSGQVR